MPTKPTNEQIDRVVDEWYGKDVSRPATLNHLPRWLIEDLKSKLHELCKPKWETGKPPNPGHYAVRFGEEKPVGIYFVGDRILQLESDSYWDLWQWIKLPE